jgi:hypothetical protein
MYMSNEELEVEKWDEYEIAASNDDAACFRWSLTIDRVSSHVTYTRKPKPNYKECTEKKSSWVLELVKPTKNAVKLVEIRSAKLKKFLADSGRECRFE